MILTIVSIVLILVVFIAIRISRKRFLIRNELRGIYSKMELELVRAQVTMDNATIRYMSGYKNIIVNPGMADIQVLSAIVMNAQREKLEAARKRIAKVESKLSPEFMALVKDFDKELEDLIKLSALKPDFLVFFASILIRFALRRFYEEVWRNLSPQTNEAQLINYGRLQVAAA